MNDRTITNAQNPPTVDQQIAAFKGATTNNGEVVAAQSGRPQGGSFVGEEMDQSQIGPEDRQAGEETEGRQTPNAAGRNAPAKSAQDRIDKAVARQRAAERRADVAEGRNSATEARLAALEQRLAGGGQTRDLTAGQAANNTRDPTAPNPASYQYGEFDRQYIIDLATWVANKQIEATEGKRNAATQQEQAQAQVAEINRKANELAKSATTKGLTDDFSEAMEAAKRDEWKLTPIVGELIFESDFGPEIFIHLANDPDEAERVAGLTPAQQARWFGTLEAKLASAASSAAPQNGQGQGQQPPAKKTTRAPPPLPSSKRLSGGGGAQPITGATTDFAAFEAMAMGRSRSN